MTPTKTHWLQNPNKNYLGHWDLPETQDFVLTIKSAQWEEVKNPQLNTAEAKRVIRWQEPKIKPFICNETNARAIMKATNVKFMEDSANQKIALYVSQTMVKREQVDCIRVRDQKVLDKVNFDKEAKILSECKTLDAATKYYLSLSHKAKADSKVLLAKDRIKSQLTK